MDETEKTNDANPGGMSGLTVPSRAELVRFGVTWEEEESKPAIADLSCIGLGADGKLVQSVGFDTPKDAQGSVKYLKGDGGDKEVIEICPSRVLHDCEVLCLVLSAAESPVRQMDLGTMNNLKLNIYSSERNKPQEVFSSVNLNEYTSTIVPTANRYSDGHQSLVVCMLYRVGNGWHIQFVLKTYPMSFWGDMLPEIKENFKILPDLEQSGDIQISSTERVVKSRPGEERALIEASYQREKLTTNEEGNAHTLPDVKVVKIDVGWEVTDPEAEDVAIEFNCAMFSIEVLFSFGWTINRTAEEVRALGMVLRYPYRKGEEVQAVSIGNPEADGARVEERQEEPEAEPEAEAEQEEDEGGEEGNESTDQAAEDEQKETEATKEPPVMASVFLNLSELPSNVHSILVAFSNLGGAGLSKVKMIYVRVQDTTDASLPRDCCVYKFSPTRDVAKHTGLVALKLFKEHHNTAYWKWRETGIYTIEGFVAREDPLSLMSEVLQGRKEFAAKLAAAAAAEEGGEENVVAPMMSFEWRIQVPGQTIPGETADDQLPFIKELAAFEGLQSSEWKRHDPWCKVVFPNGDSYFGGYVQGKKSGLGWYIFSNGGSYAGNYLEGKRQGDGLIMMPDSACYMGQFAEDKFHGQGAYFYPDGSCYVGGWESGLKEGKAVYWDKDGGCLQGNWSKGVLTGKATFDQLAHSFQGNFVKGIPAGDCTFTICADRTLELPHTAMGFLLSDNGPTLMVKGTYNIPPGAGDDAAEGEEQPDDAQQMPKPPKYDGLSFTASKDIPEPTSDVSFPPNDASLPPILQMT